jgi:hypothetical protein
LITGLASTTYNGTAYYSLIPKGCEDSDTKRIETTFATIYLGTKRNAYAAIPDTPFMAVYREESLVRKRCAISWRKMRMKASSAGTMWNISAGKRVRL